MIQIYHNPKCQKSRETLSLLKENGDDVQVIEYLKEIPSVADFKILLNKLNLKPEQILRKGEKLYKEKFSNLNMSDEEWIQIMIENPILIERPIVIRGNKALICRPPERVMELVK